jgi:hypothetical protein
MYKFALSIKGQHPYFCTFVLEQIPYEFLTPLQAAIGVVQDVSNQHPYFLLAFSTILLCT